MGCLDDPDERVVDLRQDMIVSEFRLASPIQAETSCL